MTDRMSESDLVRASWDGRVITVRVSAGDNVCVCGHEAVVHMQSVGRCCATGCKCWAPKRDYDHPGYHEFLRVKS